MLLVGLSQAYAENTLYTSLHQQIEIHSATKHSTKSTFFDEPLRTPANIVENAQAFDVSVYVGNSDPDIQESLFTAGSTCSFNFLFTSPSVSLAAGDYLLVPSEGTGLNVKYPISGKCEATGKFLKVTTMQTTAPGQNAIVAGCYADYNLPGDSIFTATYYSRALRKSFQARVHIVKPRVPSWVSLPIFEPLLTDNMQLHSYGRLTYAFSHSADLPATHISFTFPDRKSTV